MCTLIITVQGSGEDAEGSAAPADSDQPAAAGDGSDDQPAEEPKDSDVTSAAEEAAKPGSDEDQTAGLSPEDLKEEETKAAVDTMVPGDGDDNLPELGNQTGAEDEEGQRDGPRKIFHLRLCTMS